MSRMNIFNVKNKVQKIADCIFDHEDIRDKSVIPEQLKRLEEMEKIQLFTIHGILKFLE